MLVDEVGHGEPAAGSPLSVGREDVPDPQVPERASRRTYTAQYKLDVLAEYDRLDKNGKGALMRREGLYSSLLTEWRKQRDRGALQALSVPRGPKPADPVTRRTAELEADKARLEAELATARSVIRIQGELSALLAKLSPSSVVPPESEQQQ
jgi:transposase-like protein